jgi:hypothetical protein
MMRFTWEKSAQTGMPKTRSVPGVIPIVERKESEQMLNHQILYSVEDVQKIAAQAY